MKPKLTPQIAYNLAKRLHEASGECDTRLQSVIAQDPQTAYWYAADVLKAPWPEAEGVIREDFFYSTYYDLFLGEGPKTPEKLILQLTGNQDISSFTLAYIEAMLWSTNDESNDQGGDPLDDNYGPLDISVETMRAILRDCRSFYLDNYDDIREDIKRAGHDFWLTREGHGCGFWDGGWPEPSATRLTKASEAFGEVWLYVGDDGRIYGH